MLLEEMCLGQIIQQDGSRKNISTTEIMQSYKHPTEQVLDRKQPNPDRQNGSQNTCAQGTSDKETESVKQQTIMTMVKGQKNSGADVYDNIAATKVGRINIQTVRDKDCYIKGIAVISSDKLAITDFRNSSLKIVDTKQSRILSEMKLNSSPWDVVLLPVDELAVTIPGLQIIQVLSISDQLSSKRQIKVNGKCHGLAYFNQNFLVSCSFPSKIEIFSEQGDHLTCITLSVGKLLPNHVAVDVSTNKIYVSDAECFSREIVCLSLNGEITGIYRDKNLFSPRDIAVQEDGSLLVASFGIRLISSDLETSRVLQRTDGFEISES